MKRILIIAALVLAACASAQAQPRSERCPPAGYDSARLEALKAADWALPDDGARNALARALAACVAAPDPALRDGIAFEGLQHWMRAGALSPETLAALADDLQARLTAPEGAGFERPFAALVLSEVARTDRVTPWMSAERRASLLDASVTYLTSVRDYRGFDEAEGWRHGVAHGSDLMLQLALNPAFGKPELTRIRDAIASQVAPEEHFYIYGESERLAAPILYIAQRNLFSEAEWTQYFAQFPTAGENMFASQAGLARRHDVNAFLQALYLNARLDRNSDDDVLLPGVEAALRAMP
ncbi:DUF2785 domain-containing protein [Terricaulis sp.]|uniref:DUF2785 domain-containing protein n=1 Tax=Terricaulis sp. TaxID=2768686 RepID=UPI003785205A